jgi:hypothetical protein
MTSDLMQLEVQIKSRETLSPVRHHPKVPRARTGRAPRLHCEAGAASPAAKPNIRTPICEVLSSILSYFSQNFTLVRISLPLVVDRRGLLKSPYCGALSANRCSINISQPFSIQRHRRERGPSGSLTCSGLLSTRKRGGAPNLLLLGFIAKSAASLSTERCRIQRSPAVCGSSSSCPRIH